MGTRTAAGAGILQEGFNSEDRTDQPVYLRPCDIDIGPLQVLLDCSANDFVEPFDVFERGHGVAAA